MAPRPRDHGTRLLGVRGGSVTATACLSCGGELVNPRVWHGLGAIRDCADCGSSFTGPRDRDPAEVREAIVIATLDRAVAAGLVGAIDRWTRAFIVLGGAHKLEGDFAGAKRVEDFAVLVQRGEIAAVLP